MSFVDFLKKKGTKEPTVQWPVVVAADAKGILIGMTNKQVARLFFLENLAVGGVALILGIALGGLLYQALRAIVMAMFVLPYHFSLSLSLPAFGLTVAYFALIYLYALHKSRKRICKLRIYDLIYFEKLNEGAVIQTGKNRRQIFTISIILGVIGTFLIMSEKLLIGLVGAACLIYFLFAFFISFASGVPAFFERRPAKKYQGQNLLVFRTLASKLATMGIVMAVISMIFTATLITVGTGLVFQGLFKGRAAEDSCFDLYFAVEGSKQDPSAYLDYVEKNIPVEQSSLYQVYINDNAQVMDYINDHITYYVYDYEQDPILRWSDYAALRAIAGYSAVELKPGQYLIHCITYLEETLRGYTQPITFGETTLTPGGIYTEHLTQGTGVANGRSYILVVPDETVEGLGVHHIAYAAKTVEPVTAEQYRALGTIAGNEYDERENPLGYAFVSTKANGEAEVASQTTKRLSRDAYAAQKARLVEQRNDAQKAEAEIQAELFEQTRDRSIYVEQYQRYADMEALPDDAIADLLDRVTVWPDGRLEVSLKFLNELSVSAVL